MTIPLDKLKSITTIISHERCPDGIAAALILKDVLPDAKLIFCQYSTPAHDNLVAEPGMIFADFSPPQARVQEFIDKEAIVLDHHRTQKAVVAAFGPLGVFGDEAADPGVSGAVLAYREVWNHLYEGWESDPDFADWVEDFARVAGIRDTWQKTDADWARSCVQSSALFFVPQDDLIAAGLRGVYEDWDKRYGWAGKVSYTKHLKAVARAVKDGCWYKTSHGTNVVIFQGTKMSSDAAETPGASEADLVVGFDVIYEGGQVKYLYSTRSRKEFDCSALAKRNAGGGHVRAAGFNIVSPPADPYSTFLTTLDTHENELALSKAEGKP